METNWIHN